MPTFVHGVERAVWRWHFGVCVLFDFADGLRHTDGERHNRDARLREPSRATIQGRTKTLVAGGSTPGRWAVCSSSNSESLGWGSTKCKRCQSTHQGDVESTAQWPGVDEDLADGVSIHVFRWRRCHSHGRLSSMRVCHVECWLSKLFVLLYRSYHSRECVVISALCHPVGVSLVFGILVGRPSKTLRCELKRCWEDVHATCAGMRMPLEKCGHMFFDRWLSVFVLSVRSPVFQSLCALGSTDRQRCGPSWCWWAFEFSPSS